MNKEQIQQKFDEILIAKNYKFSEDGILKSKYVLQEDIEELMSLCFNLGIEVAAYNADADHTILSEDAEYLFGQMRSGQDYEVYVLKNSILQHKL